MTITKSIELTLCDDGTKWHASWAKEDDPFWSNEPGVLVKRLRVSAVTKWGATHKAKRKLRAHVRAEQRAQRRDANMRATLTTAVVDIDVTEIR